MKKTWNRIVITTALMGTLVYPLTLAARPGTARLSDASDAAGTGERTPSGDSSRHRGVGKDCAVYHMEHAAHDFGGHRVEAWPPATKPSSSLRLALQYDKE